MYNVYAIFDKRAKTYSLPIFSSNDSIAMRTFLLSFNESSILYRAPEDFSLMRIGTYEEDSSILCSEDPFLVITALEIRDIIDREKVKENSDVQKEI